ncbi:MAG: deoxyguanosinetriphosphate triphosphohydrolase [Chloroflexi bacterium]|nr:deoxyguanosinetriphosphate triphosphohydrolase [Chloroflexota bacterium]MCL5276129.1 deoxyguanosinetriphosphate triphosphohydrolase [Chloroflexota bacterium]
MRMRQQLEQIEALSLAPYAAQSAASRGREYPEAEAPYRTAFQRDRERVLHTTSFRRLQGKTQVFIATEGDYYRTRITHTLEVAQIGRTIARSLGANEDLVEGICLAHDLGHPPFGHSGEAKLSALMQDHGGFDHNRHSYRIVTELEDRYTDFPGLNLTYEFREGLVKHETEYDVILPAAYEPKLCSTLESQIASFADELAYNTHDVDDGLRSGLLNVQDVAQVGWWRRACESAGISLDEPFTDRARHRIIRRQINLMVTDLLEETTRRIERAGVKSPDDVRRHPENLVAYPEETRRLNRELKDFLYEYLYRHYHVLRIHTKSDRIIDDLFRVYNSEPRILPPGPRSWLSKLPKERVVCNYIAGMTDRFALEDHARLFDPSERA